MEMSENNEMMETGKDNVKVLAEDIPVRRNVGDNTSIVEERMLDGKKSEAETTDDRLEVLFDGSSVPLLDSSDGELDTDPENNAEYEADSENSDEFTHETDSEDTETIADVVAYHLRMDQSLGGAVEDWKDRVVGEIEDEKYKLTGITPIHEWVDSQPAADNVIEEDDEVEENDAVGEDVRDESQGEADNNDVEKLVTTIDDENVSAGNEVMSFYRYAEAASPRLRLREVINRLDNIIQDEERSQSTGSEKMNSEHVVDEATEEIDHMVIVEEEYEGESNCDEVPNEGNDTIDLIDLNVKTPDNTVEMNDMRTPEPIMSSSLLDETLSEEEEFYEKGILLHPTVNEMNAALELIIEKYKKDMAKVDETETRPLTILIEGNIGSGKSTFLKHFEKFKNVKVITEPVHKWRNLKGDNLLQKMYEDPERWALVFQTYVQLTMLEQHTDRGDEEVKIMERSLYSARYCFVEDLFRTKKMQASEYEVISSWFKFLNSRMHDVDLGVDLLIYLQTSPEKAMERVQKRNRGEENLISLSHIRDMHQLHEEWLIDAKYPRPGPVVVINADEDLEDIIGEFIAQENLILNKSEEDVDTNNLEERFAKYFNTTE